MRFVERDVHRARSMSRAFFSCKLAVHGPREWQGRAWHSPVPAPQVQIAIDTYYCFLLIAYLDGRRSGRMSRLDRSTLYRDDGVSKNTSPFLIRVAEPTSRRAGGF